MQSEFVRARDFLLAHRTDFDSARRGFRWPVLDKFNWALDYFDAMAAGNTRMALWVIREDGSEVRRSFAELSVRSNQVANFLRALGVRRGDHMLLMLGNEVELWEILLAACKLGAVVIPAATLLRAEDLRDRLDRGEVRHVVAGAAHTSHFAALGGDYARISVGGESPGWRRFDDAWQQSATFAADGVTRADDPLLLYFTSGTTAKPKLVAHSHQSYPVGHLSTMYWIGLQPGDVHWNISSPGWAKHAWSCCVCAVERRGHGVRVQLRALPCARTSCGFCRAKGITTLCAPPTVWRMLIQEKLSDYPVKLREAVSAGEPLNPEVIEQVQAAWGITIRDGFGQTETTAMIGNSPGQPLKTGSMGRPLPGYSVQLLDTEGQTAEEGELCLDLSAQPLGLMLGYAGQPGASCRACKVTITPATWQAATQTVTSLISGASDDVFKASDYRISPFELESVLLQHPAVAEAAVVPCPDPLRFAVPKAFVVLAPGYDPGSRLARDIFAFVRRTVAPYKRIRRLEFRSLPKTISGKIRRVELRSMEHARSGTDERRELEFFEEDFPDL